MKPGDIVRHKLTGERLKIVRVHVNGEIVAGEWIDRPKEQPVYKVTPGQERPTAICLVENLEIIPQTLKIKERK